MEKGLGPGACPLFPCASRVSTAGASTIPASIPRTAWEAMLHISPAQSVPPRRRSRSSRGACSQIDTRILSTEGTERHGKGRRMIRADDRLAVARHRVARHSDNPLSPDRPLPCSFIPVQSNGDMGSPRVARSIRRSRSWSRVRSFAAIGRRPPPERWTRERSWSTLLIRSPARLPSRLGRSAAPAPIPNGCGYPGRCAEEEDSKCGRTRQFFRIKGVESSPQRRENHRRQKNGHHK